MVFLTGSIFFLDFGLHVKFMCCYFQVNIVSLLIYTEIDKLFIRFHILFDNFA